MPGTNSGNFGRTARSDQSAGSLRCAISIVFNAHSSVQISLNITTPPGWRLFLKHLRSSLSPATLVDLIAHSLVHASLNNTAPVARRCLLKHVSSASSTSGRIGKLATVAGFSDTITAALAVPTSSLLFGVARAAGLSVSMAPLVRTVCSLSGSASGSGPPVPTVSSLLDLQLEPCRGELQSSWNVSAERACKVTYPPNQRCSAQ